MSARTFLFGLVAIALLVTYGVLGSRLASSVLPFGTASPAPPRPSAPVEAPNVPGTIAFGLGGDIYVLRNGRYANVTTEGRNFSPGLSPDGRTLIFARRETIQGTRSVDGQITPARLHYSDIIKKDALGGSETILLTGLRDSAANGVAGVAWEDGPAISADGSRVAVVLDDGAGSSDLYIYDVGSVRSRPILIAKLSDKADLADPSWAPDGKTIVITSYTLGGPRLLLVPIDGSAVRTVRIEPIGEAYRPAYSEDGRWLIYTLRNPRGANDVHAVEIDTGRDVALTNDGRSWNGVFSPDGSSIAFLRETGGVIDLWAMELDRALAGATPGRLVKLTHGEGIDGQSRIAWGR